MPENSLKEKTAKGLLWGGINNGAMQVLNLAFGIITARILNDSDYGMVGMLSIFSLIAGSLQESGFTAALVNKKEISHQDYNAVFWFCSGLSLTLYLILAGCAPLIADFYRNDELIPLARYSFIGFFIASLGIPHSAYLFRNLMVKQKALSSIIALVVSGCTGVAMALLGYSYWGIATQSIVYVSVINLCYLYFSPWRPTLQFDFRPLKSMVSFSSRLLLTNIFNHINNNLFSIILGRYYSEREVGQFNQANKWNLMGHSLITGMVSSVALPVLRQVADDSERQCRIFRKMLRFTAFISFPVMLGLSLIAPEMITLTIGSKWLPSANILQLLAIGGAFLPVTSLYTNLLISKGKSNLFMWNTIAQGVSQLVVMYLLYPYGIQCMIKVYIAINVGWLLAWHYFVWREIRLSLFHAIKDVFSFGLIAAIIMAGVYFLTRSLTNLYLLITAKILLAGILYPLVMWLSGSATFKEALNYIFKKKLS